MARLLIAALRLAGHEVQIVSRLRSYLPRPETGALDAIHALADTERKRIAEGWRTFGRPDLWLSYHPYYKAPDLIGPQLCHAFGIRYATAETSYSQRRNVGVWGTTQALVVEAVSQAAFNICFTERDRRGLASIAPGARLDMLPPYIDTAPFADSPATGGGGRLMTVAMMRQGDKFESFKLLAEALARLDDLAWTLSVVGDGPMRNDVVALFARFPAERVKWCGEVPAERVPGLLADGGIYVWPGTGEAYGLAYLEAQAAGLPAIAQNTAGVPEVVKDGRTGLLTAEGDAGAFASAIRRLLCDETERQRLAAQARQFVLGERSLKQAAARLSVLMGPKS